MKRLLNLIVPLSFALVFPLSGAVIQNDAIISTSPAGAGSPPGTFFYLTQTAPPGNGMFLYEVAMSGQSVFTFSYWGIAELNSVFIATLGDIFDNGFVGSQPPLASNSDNPGSGSFTLLSGESLYLGYFDNRFFTDDDLFGWARVTNVDGELVVDASATAVGGGIVVGTLTQVPEPATGAIFALAMAGALVSRTKRG